MPSIAAEWVSIEGTNFQFDKSRIKIDKKTGNILVWEKYVMLEGQVKDLQNKLKKIGIPIDFSDYSFSIDLNGMNCKDEAIGVISRTYYNNSGGVIYSWKEEGQEQQLSPVVPESIGEARLQAVCKFVAKEKQKKK